MEIEYGFSYLAVLKLPSLGMIEIAVHVDHANAGLPLTILTQL